MKPFLLLPLLLITLLVNAQKPHVPDDHITINIVNGKRQIVDYVNDRVLCKEINVDDIVSATHHGVMGFQKDDKYGLLNIYGKIVVPAVFDDYGMGSGSFPLEIKGDYFAVRKGERIGLVDSNGRYVVPLGNYDHVWDAKAGFGGAEKDGLFGLFKNGKTILPMEYYSDYSNWGGFEFDQETEVITKSMLSGLVNQKGIIVQPLIYQSIEEVDGYRALQDTNWREHLADASGKFVFERTFSNISDIHGNYVFAEEGRKYGIAKLDGTIVCPFEYDNIGMNIHADKIFVKQNGRCGIFDLKNPGTVAFDFDNEYTPMWLTSGLAPVTVNGLWGMVNTDGKMVHEAVFENPSVPVFYDGNALVFRDGKKGILKNTGELIVPCEYESIEPNAYNIQIVRKNGKAGLMSSDFKELIPCAYDEILNFSADRYLVKTGEQTGVYDLKKGLIIPVEYDLIEIYTVFEPENRDLILTRKNDKYGYRTINGQEVIPNVIEKSFGNKNGLLLASSNGQLKCFSLDSGKEMALSPDSVLKFENTSFVLVNSMWYCIANADNRLIGSEYSMIGLFDDAGRAVANPSGAFHQIAINSKGEEIKPGYILLLEPLVDTILMTDNQDSIMACLEKYGLIDPRSNSVNDQMDKLVIDIVPFELYDDMGFETGITEYRVFCFDRSSYYDEGSAFPSNPVYEFDFSKHYINWSKPNAQGWRWATKRNGYWDERRPEITPQSVLVNSEGKELTRDNYIPVRSIPFMMHTFNAAFPWGTQQQSTGSEMSVEQPWDSLGKYPAVIDSIKTYFPAAKGLSTQQFIRQYKDSIYTSSQQTYIYSMDYEEVPAFQYYFYKKEGLQLFEVPPPAEVKFRFVMTDPKKIKGGEKLPDYHLRKDPAITNSYTPENQIPFLQAIAMGDTSAFVFGDIGYFVYPKFNAYTTESGKKEKIRQLLNDPAYKIVASDLQKAASYENLVETAMAKVLEYGYEDVGIRDFVYNHSNDVELYYYSKNLGLVMENELLLEPKFLSIATDNTALGRKGVSTFIAIDSLQQVWRYDLSSRKLIRDKNATVAGATREGIFTQSKTTRLYGFNNYGAQIINTTDEYIRKVNLVPNMNDIEQLEFLGNCDFSQPLMNSYGEDSIIYLQDGTAEFVYLRYCDTNIMGKYGRFQNGVDLHAYKRIGQPFELVYKYAPGEVYTFSKTAFANSLPLNHYGNADFTVEETNDGLRFILNDRTLEITEKEYFAIRDQDFMTNGYGGIYRKGRYIPYQTLLPFPEKHKINIHMKAAYYLVGEAEKLELVKLNGDQTVTASGLYFKDAKEMEDNYYNDFDLRYKVQDFMGLDSW